jgi:hypothetical protein
VDAFKFGWSIVISAFIKKYLAATKRAPYVPTLRIIVRKEQESRDSEKGGCEENETSTTGQLQTKEGKDLVYTFEGRDCLAFVFVQRGANDVAVGHLYVRLGWVAHECEGVLHPVLVVTLELAVRNHTVFCGSDEIVMRTSW